MYKWGKLFWGCLLTSIGTIIFSHSTITTGGIAGLALMISYFFNLQFAIIFFAINIPFFIFSFAKMGWKFTVSSIASVTILSLMTSIDKWLPSFIMPEFIGAILGGILAGAGVSIIIINGASLGGTNMVSVFLHNRYRLNPGIMNFIFDFSVIILSFNSMGISKGIFSLLSIAVTSIIISYSKARMSDSFILEPISIEY